MYNYSTPFNMCSTTAVTNTTTSTPTMKKVCTCTYNCSHIITTYIWDNLGGAKTSNVSDHSRFGNAVSNRDGISQRNVSSQSKCFSELCQEVVEYV